MSGEESCRGRGRVQNRVSYKVGKPQIEGERGKRKEKKKQKEERRGER